jgi:hypothetical protein
VGSRPEAAITGQSLLRFDAPKRPFIGIKALNTPRLASLPSLTKMGIMGAQIAMTMNRRGLNVQMLEIKNSIGLRNCWRIRSVGSNAPTAYRLFVEGPIRR